MKSLWITCDVCGAKFKPGNKNGLPNGVGFGLADGTVINICSDCIIKQGNHEQDNIEILKSKGFILDN